MLNAVLIILLKVVLVVYAADVQRMLNIDCDIVEEYEISEIPVSAITIEKINQNLYNASVIHDENKCKSWSEAHRYYAVN